MAKGQWIYVFAQWRDSEEEEEEEQENIYIYMNRWFTSEMSALHSLCK